MRRKTRYVLAALAFLVMLSCNLPMPTAPAGGTQPPSAVGIEPSGSEPQPVASPTLEELGPPPSFEEIIFPEGIDAPVQRDGKWYLKGQPVALSYHRGATGEKELWLTLENETDWPIMIQNPEGVWRAGLEAWNANLTVVNTNESPLILTVYTTTDGGSLEELTTQEIAAYEIFNLATLPPTRYQFRFQFTTGDAYDLTCDVEMRQDSRLVFTVVPVGVAVAEEGFIPKSNRDLDVRYSPLCGGGS